MHPPPPPLPVGVLLADAGEDLDLLDPSRQLADRVAELPEVLVVLRALLLERPHARVVRLDGVPRGLVLGDADKSV